jgi:hypothetical protein
MSTPSSTGTTVPAPSIGGVTVAASYTIGSDGKFVVTGTNLTGATGTITDPTKNYTWTDFFIGSNPTPTSLELHGIPWPTVTSSTGGTFTAAREFDSDLDPDAGHNPPNQVVIVITTASPQSATSAPTTVTYST